MTEWIRFILCAVFIVAALFCFATSVLGVWRFGFVMNRMHASGIGDTLGLFLMVLGVAVADGLTMDVLKLVLVVGFMWFTSPTSSHMLAMTEYYTNPELYRHVKRRAPGDAD